MTLNRFQTINYCLDQTECSMNITLLWPDCGAVMLSLAIIPVTKYGMTPSQGVFENSVQGELWCTIYQPFRILP
jgi:hypothetical protein